MEKKENLLTGVVNYDNLFLHIPHSSSRFPADASVQGSLSEEELLLIDFFTDELFAHGRSTENIDMAVFPYCRLYCDVERLIKDPLEAAGFGISYYIRGHAYSTLSRAFDLYADFHAMVAKRLVAQSGTTLLIDCHSFSSLPNLLNQCPPDIDICIGYNEDETRPGEEVLGLILEHFKSRGYKVGINNPFSNSKTFSVPTTYHTVMIEVNKRLYMNEQTLAKTVGFCQLRDDIQSLYEMLLR